MRDVRSSLTAAWERTSYKVRHHEIGSDRPFRTRTGSENNLLNDFVGTHEDRGRYSYADAAGNLIADGHLETGWLFKGHLGGVAAGKDTHNKVGGSQPQLGNIGAVSDKATIG